MLTVSNYHYVRTNFKTKYPSIFGITPFEFKNQLLSLKNEGEFISALDLLSNKEEVLSSNDNYILITFDDGLKEQFDNAMPVLDVLEIPAIFFANSKNFEEDKVSTVHKIHLLRSILSPDFFLKLLSDLKLLHVNESDLSNAKEIYRFDEEKSALLKYVLNFKLDFQLQEKLISSLFEQYFEEQQVLDELYMDIQHLIYLSVKGYLGSHTHSHYPLGLLTNDALHFELKHSKEYFEKLTNSSIDCVAYPYGFGEACTPKVADMAESLGYKIGFTTKKGINLKEINPLLMNRFDCNDLPGGKNLKIV